MKVAAYLVSLMKKGRLFGAVLVLAGVAAGTLVAVGCGAYGGGGGGSGTRSTITGNIVSAQAFLTPAPERPGGSLFAWLSLVGTAWAQEVGVGVCLAGSTDVCDLTDANGGFTLTLADDLAAPVCLEITGSNFSASLCLPFAIPARSAVQIPNITCNTSDGTCAAGAPTIQESFY